MSMLRMLGLRQFIVSLAWVRSKDYVSKKMTSTFLIIDHIYTFLKYLNEIN